MKWLLSAAVLLAAGMVAAGAIAGRTLRQRDDAVREGVMLRAAHDVERELRESGPDSAEDLLAAIVVTSAASAVELSANDQVLHRAGTPRGKFVDSPLFLGPSWRGLAGGGMGMGRRSPPFRLRVWPPDGMGDSSRLAALITWGSIAAAIALLGFAAIAARGVAARQHASALDAERRRLEVVSAAGAGLAHRIRNPLATIKATAQMLQQDAAGTHRDRATRIVDASIRIESLVQELLTFARPIEVHAEPLDLREIVRTIDANAQGREPVLVHADREHVMAAVEELVANAQQAGDENPELVVRRDAKNALIEVRDHGNGLALDAARAFDPYVTTRADGTGLGLPTIRALIRANGGEVTLGAREGGGCVGVISLPAVTS